MTKTKNTYFFILLLCFSFFISCKSQTKSKIVVGANRIEAYIPFLEHKAVAVVANQTSVIFKEKNYTHLVDSLKTRGMNLVKVFSPEHGFRGVVDAAVHVKDGMDQKTGLPIVSLYGKNKKPKKEQLEGIDVVLFDIQDVGVRFYTYISTLHYVMEACAENNIPVIVLDRPNPNGHYVDGPMLDMKYASFVGKHPVPLVYGMTIGEYAQMINGQGWLKNKIQCNLTVVPLKNYQHDMRYSLPIRPSPNLPNATAVNLYPSLGFFEGTPINAGRGTEFQFQRYGSSEFEKTTFNYVPVSNFGSKYPKHQHKKCYGVDLSQQSYQSKVNMKWLLDAYQKSKDKKAFFGKTFTIHAGDTLLELQLKNGFTAKQIEDSWKKDIAQFKKVRAKYLIYQ